MQVSKSIYRVTILVLLLCPLLTTAQQRVNANQARSQRMAKKDTTLIMSCMLLNATEHKEEKKSSLYDTEELKLILSSATDTTVKAPADAVISTVQSEADGTYEIVFYHNDFWFWLSGVTKPLVKPRQQVKNGQAIGILDPQAKIELLLFNFETPADPKEFLKCDNLGG